MTLAFLVAKTAVSLASCWSVWPSQSNINKMWLLFSKSCPFDIPNPYTRLNGNRIWFCFTVVNPPLSLGKKHQLCEKWKTFEVTFTSSLASPLDCCRERSRFIKWDVLFVYNQCFLGWAGVLYCMDDCRQNIYDDKWSGVMDWCDILPSFLTHTWTVLPHPKGTEIKSTHFQKLCLHFILFCVALRVCVHLFTSWK